MKLKIIRFLKITFIRLRLHVIFSWLNPFFKEMIWMSDLSKWANKHGKIPINDFPSEWNYEKRFGLYRQIIVNESLDGPVNYLEFGVAGGASFNWWMHQNTHPGSRFYGFDTFTGLPEDFGSYKKGTFASGNELPSITDSRGQFFQGLFQQTLPGFLKTFDNSNKLIIMLDADLYTATLFTLASLAPFLKKGDIILFDEFSVPTHEFKAFREFCDTYYLNPELIGAANNYYFTAFKVVNTLV